MKNAKTRIVATLSSKCTSWAHSNIRKNIFHLKLLSKQYKRKATRLRITSTIKRYGLIQSETCVNVQASSSACSRSSVPRSSSGLGEAFARPTSPSVSSFGALPSSSATSPGPCAHPCGSSASTECSFALSPGPHASFTHGASLLNQPVRMVMRRSAARKSEDSRENADQAGGQREGEGLTRLEM